MVVVLCLKVWGGVVVNEEKILRFCSGDPLTYTRKSISLFLSVDKSILQRMVDSLLGDNGKLPFSILVPDNEDPLSEKVIRLDGTKLQPRQNRFINALRPQFVQDSKTSNLGEFFSKLITLENDWADHVFTRYILGM